MLHPLTYNDSSEQNLAQSSIPSTRVSSSTITDLYARSALPQVTSNSPACSFASVNGNALCSCMPPSIPRKVNSHAFIPAEKFVPLHTNPNELIACIEKELNRCIPQCRHIIRNANVIIGSQPHNLKALFYRAQGYLIRYKSSLAQPGDLQAACQDLDAIIEKMTPEALLNPQNPDFECFCQALRTYIQIGSQHGQIKRKEDIPKFQKILQVISPPSDLDRETSASSTDSSVQEDFYPLINMSEASSQSAASPEETASEDTENTSQPVAFDFGASPPPPAAESPEKIEQHLKKAHSSLYKNEKKRRYNVAIIETNAVIKHDAENSKARLLRAEAHMYRFCSATGKIEDLIIALQDLDFVIERMPFTPPLELLKFRFLRAKANMLKFSKPSISSIDDINKALVDYTYIIEKMFIYLSPEETLKAHFLRAKAYFQASYPDNSPFLQLSFQDLNYIINKICPFNKASKPGALPKANHPYFKRYCKAILFLIKIAIRKKEGQPAIFYAKLLAFLTPNDPKAQLHLKIVREQFSHLFNLIG